MTELCEVYMKCETLQLGLAGHANNGTDCSPLVSYIVQRGVRFVPSIAGLILILHCYSH